jgi:hypothetical protein
MRYYITKQKVAVSRPDEANTFFSIYLILPAAAFNRNEYQKQKKVSEE